jgi:hypothetical protein
MLVYYTASAMNSQHQQIATYYLYIYTETELIDRPVIELIMLYSKCEACVECEHSELNQLKKLEVSTSKYQKKWP